MEKQNSWNKLRLGGVVLHCRQQTRRVGAEALREAEQQVIVLLGKEV